MKEQVVDALKMAVKAKGFTYKALAAQLGISEASMKRTFSESSFSLGRFLQVCELIDVSAENLFALSTKQSNQYYEYSQKQEVFFAKNPQHLAFFDLLIKAHSPKQIAQRFDLNQKQLYQYLSDLQKLKLIEWLPKDKVRHLTPTNVQWRKSGPLRKKLLPAAKQEFLDNAFQGEQAENRFFLIDLSEKHIKKLKLKINDLIGDIVKESELDSLVGEKRNTTGIFMAYRPWNFSQLELKRSKKI